jgi:hypothetical protein
MMSCPAVEALRRLHAYVPDFRAGIGVGAWVTVEFIALLRWWPQ